MAVYNMIYSSVSESEEKMLDELRAILLKHDIDGSLHYAISLVLSEAFTNALVHGNKKDPRRNIIIKLAINDTEVCAEIEDEGQHGLEYIKRRQPPDLLSEGGRGIDLMELYSDSVEFTETPTGGLKVSFQFSRKSEKETNVSKYI